MYPFCGQNEQNRQVERGLYHLASEVSRFLGRLGKLHPCCSRDGLVGWASLTGVVGYVEKHLHVTSGGWGQGYLYMHIDFWEFSRTVSAFLRQLLLGLLKWKRWWIWNSFGSFGRSSCKRRWTSSPTLCPLGAILPPPRNSDHQDDHTVDGRNPANHLGCLKPCK